MYAKAAAGKAAGGLNFWILYHDAYPDYDGFGVYYPADASTVNIISTQARKMRDLSEPIPYEGQWASAVLCDTVHFEITGDPVDLSVSDVHIDNTTLTHTDDYIKDTDGAVVTATVTGTGLGIDDISADLRGLGGGESVPPGSYVDDVATWTIAHVTCTPSDGTVTVTVTATDESLKGTASGSDQITADNTDPGAVTGFGASPHHGRVALTWNSPSGLDSHYYGVLVRYDGAGTYPDYTTLGTYPSGPTAGDGTAFDQTGAVTGGDHLVSGRDIYYYTAFAYDQAMNYGLALSSAQGRATNYRLADVSADMSPGGGDYDGLVDYKDINSLSAAYWLTPLVSPHNECDVGPTSDSKGTGIPQPDDHVDFEDLMIFSLTYGQTGKYGAPAVWLAGPSHPGPASLRLEASPTDGPAKDCWLSLVLDGNGREVKGASAVLTYDPQALRLEEVSLAPPLDSAGEQVLLFWQEMHPVRSVWTWRFSEAAQPSRVPVRSLA
jgi:hypothetical protein